MLTLKRLDVLEDDLHKEASFDVMIGVCVFGFNVSCLELERGPFIESLDEIKNFNCKTQYLGQCPDIKHYIANISG